MSAVETTQISIEYSMSCECRRGMRSGSFRELCLFSRSGFFLPLLYIPNSQFIFEMMSLCYLAGCTSPEDTSMKTCSSFSEMAPISCRIFRVPRVNEGYSSKSYFSVCPINKNRMDLNMAIIHDLSHFHQTRSEWRSLTHVLCEV